MSPRSAPPPRPANLLRSGVPDLEFGSDPPPRAVVLASGWIADGDSVCAIPAELGQLTLPILEPEGGAP